MKIPERFASLPAYTPVEPLEEIAARLGLPLEQIAKLDSNENPYGPSPRVRQALAGLPYPHIYPDPECRALRQALARFTGAPAEALMVGSGADELIALLCLALLDPGDKVVICPPTFGMYALDALAHSGQVVAVPRQADFSLDIPAICTAVQLEHPKLLFLASPNNPDGSLASASHLEALLEMPVLVVLDEAYIEFTRAGGRLGEDLSRIGQAAERDNLVVLRTFSKWAGLAGLRVGYGAFPSWLLPTLWKIKQPYNVNAAGIAAALATLEDSDTLAENVALLRAERERLAAGLAQIPYLKPFPSEANFIFCKVEGRTAAALQDRLASRGILIRIYQNTTAAEYIRVGVGRPQDSQRLLRALEEEI